MPAPGFPTGISREPRPRTPHARHNVVTDGPEGHMLQLAGGLFLVLHGLVAAAVWVAPAGPDAPFDPSSSWLIGDSRPVAVVVAVLVGIAAVSAGIGVLMDAAWWPGAAVVAGFAGLVLTVVWFDPWLVLGVAISLVIFTYGLVSLPTRSTSR